MRIALFAQTFTPQKEGGAEIVARRCAEQLSIDHEVKVFSLALSGAAEETLPQGVSVPVERLAYHNAYLPAVGRAQASVLQKLHWHGRNALGGVAARDLRAALKLFAPDVIYLHNATAFLPQLGQVARAMGVPIVMHLHDYNLLCPRTNMYRNGQNCSRPCADCGLLTAAWRQATRQSVTDAIAVSAFVRDRLKGHGVMPNARWHVLHNVEPPARLAAWQPNTCPEGSVFTFGFLGALAAPKGLALLIKAFLALPEGTARLLIGGRGDENFVAPLRAATAGADVEWLGHVDPNSVLERIDALVVPSLWHEPFGLVVLEGLNRGLKVIGSTRGGIVEILQGSAHGVLFDPDRAGDLRDKMEQVMARGVSLTRAQTDLAEAAWVGYFRALEHILERATQRS